MRIVPTNRHLLISSPEAEPTEEKEISSGLAGFVMPDGVTVESDQYLVVRVEDIAQDCSIPVNKGDSVIIPSNMVVDVTTKTCGVKMVQENYVLGVLYSA